MAYYLHNSERCRFQKGEPVYDGLLAHVIIPEAIKRLGNYESVEQALEDRERNINHERMS